MHLNQNSSRLSMQENYHPMHGMVTAFSKCSLKSIWLQIQLLQNQHSTMSSIKQGQPVQHKHCGCLKRYLFVTLFHFLAVNRFHLDCSTVVIRRAFVEEPQVISSI